MTALPWPPILVITDRNQCAEPLEARAAALFRGGCRWLSLREKDLGPPERRALLERLIAIAEPFGATVGVHDDLEAARALKIPLHLPADGDVAAARRLLGGGLPIGKSCHDAAEIAAASRDGADYVTLSPFFPSASKPGYRAAAGPRRHRIVAEAALPVLALGGVTHAMLPELKGGAVKGIAIMGEAMRARSGALVPRTSGEPGPGLPDPSNLRTAARGLLIRGEGAQLADLAGADDADDLQVVAVSGDNAVPGETVLVGQASSRDCWKACSPRPFLPRM